MIHCPCRFARLFLHYMGNESFPALPTIFLLFSSIPMGKSLCSAPLYPVA